ncbi:MAG: adenylyl-sulfate kinase [Myxococcales bacterium]|nr:adenylyl-sulfate kinase [Myxococcales bacterium]
MTKHDRPVSENITWHHGKLDDAMREEKLGQKGAIVWLTGLSASGKSTIAREVEYHLVQNGINAAVLDGDNIRHGLNKDLGFSPADRTENIRRIGEVAKLMADANIIVLTAFISPYKADRNMVRALVKPGQFIEAYVDASLSVCEERDPKGLYKKARMGQIPEFTGISAPYEAPDNPELVIRAGEESIEESTKAVIDYLQSSGIL